MYSKVKIKGHPVHPMLVAFPITFYLLTLVAFVVYQYAADPFWFRLGYFANIAGVIGALLAAVPGFIDWAVGISNQSRAKRHGLIHMSLNVFALLLYALNLWLLRGMWMEIPDTAGRFIVLPVIGSVLTVAAGIYGWELIAEHKVGVNLSPEQEILEKRRDVGAPAGQKPIEQMRPHPV